MLIWYLSVTTILLQASINSAFNNHQQCGIPKRRGKRSNGPTLKIYTNPWAVALVDKSMNKLVCSGSIISEKHVITAAHCKDGRDESDFLLVLGENRYKERDNGGTTRYIKKFNKHPNYRADVADYDIAIIEVKTKMSFGTNISPICLPKYSQRREDDFIPGVKKGLKIIGYGNKFVRDDFLTSLSSNVMTIRYCNDKYKDIMEKELPNRFYIKGPLICTTDGHDSDAATCKGDSGGPATIPHWGKIYQVAVLYGANNDCVSTYPKILNRITKVMDWIDKITGKFCNAQNYQGCCSKKNQCGIYEGGCKNDDDCDDGLVCGNFNCPAGYPRTAHCCT